MTHVSPSARGIAAAAAGIALAALPALGAPGLWTAWLAFCAMTVVVLALDAALAPRIDDVDLLLPPILHVGAASDAVLRVTAAGRRTQAEVQLDVSDTIEQPPPARAAIGGGAEPLRLQLLPKRRGLAEVEAAWIRAPGPLGLMARSTRVSLGRSAPIVPNLPGVRASALRFWSAREYAAGIKIERFVGDGTEFDSLREFVPGLDRRSVDWKSSARHTKLLARQFRAERSHQIIVAVDTGRLMAEALATNAAAARVPRLDHAVHAALLLAYFSARSGDRIGMFSFDERPRRFLPPRGGMGAFRALARESGALAYSTAETNFTLGLTELTSRLHRRSLIVVITEFVDTITAQLMVESVERLARRHLVVFVALRDPLLAELVAADPRSALDAHRALVADGLERDRELVLKRLARHGVFCIDALPGQVGVALVNRYLDIKRRELV
jgi:uncharacterized protein (DUF58 family)